MVSSSDSNGLKENFLPGGKQNLQLDLCREMKA